MNEILHTKFGTASNKSIAYYRITSKKEGNLGKLLHRLIWEDFYQCNVPEGYVVHHKDGDKYNNCILNLQLLPQSDHIRLHNSGENSCLYGKPLSEDHKKKISKTVSDARNTTGYFRVSKHYASQYKQGFTWRYSWHEDGEYKCMISVSLDKLKQKVLAKGLEWRVV